MMPIQCVAHGWDRESWDGERDGRACRFFYPERVFWWYSVALERHFTVVQDGEPAPSFEIVNAGFRVVKCSADSIEVVHER